MVIVSCTTLLTTESLLAGKLEHQVFMTAATPDRPAQLGRKDNQPTAYGRLEPSATQVWCQCRPGTLSTKDYVYIQTLWDPVPGCASIQTVCNAGECLEARAQRDCGASKNLDAHKSYWVSDSVRLLYLLKPEPAFARSRGARSCCASKAPVPFC